MQKRAYSLVEIKSFDEDRRELTGWATTPALDRVGDVVEPLGARFAPDLPLLLHHDPRLVVGRAQLGKPTAKGIPFTATLPKIEQAGALRDRIEEAWLMCKHRLCTGVSIGFRPVNGQVERIEGGGLRYKAFEIIELSIVPLRANQDATIETVKSLDLAGPPVAVAPAPVGGGRFFDGKRLLKEIQAELAKDPPKDSGEMFALGLRALGLHLGLNAKAVNEAIEARLTSLESSLETLAQRVSKLELSGPPAVTIDIDRSQNGLMSRITVTPTTAEGNAKAATEQVIAALVHSNSRGQ